MITYFRVILCGLTLSGMYCPLVSEGAVATFKNQAEPTGNIMGGVPKSLPSLGGSIQLSQEKEASNLSCKNQYEQDPSYRGLVQEIRGLRKEKKALQKQIKQFLKVQGHACPHQEYVKKMGESLKMSLETDVKALQVLLSELERGDTVVPSETRPVSMPSMVPLRSR